MTTLDPNLVTSHAQSLSGLNAGTTYHYRVHSKDANNNDVVSVRSQLHYRRRWGIDADDFQGDGQWHYDQWGGDQLDHERGRDLAGGVRDDDLVRCDDYPGS